MNMLSTIIMTSSTVGGAIYLQPGSKGAVSEMARTEGYRKGKYFKMMMSKLA